MLKIRRVIQRKTVKREAQTRGPFLTEDEEFDAGHRRIVVTLHPRHLQLRHARGSRAFPLTYAKAIAVARQEHTKELRKLKKP